MADIDPTQKIVRIRCETGFTLSLDKCMELQGELKELSIEGAAALKRSIIELGFISPIQIWKKPDDTHWIEDGHQRVRVLKSMRDDGWIVPDLPVAWIHAADEKEAQRIVAANISQYGRVTGQGLYQWMTQWGFTPEDLPKWDFPWLSNELFKMEYFKEYAPANDEKIMDESVETANECPKCGYKW